MSDMKKTLILGGSSYIGRHLFQQLGNSCSVATYYKNLPTIGIYFDSMAMSLTDIISRSDGFTHAVVLIGDTRADYCAAYPKESYQLNVSSIKNIIDNLYKLNIKPVFASTEWVFDGVKGGYIETDLPSPVLTYGDQKVEVEEYLQESNNPYTILRLSKVFGIRRNDGTLFTTWLDAIEQKQAIRCAEDQVFSPIHVRDAVNSIIRLIQMDCDGIYHISNPSSYSRLELLDMLLARTKVHFPFDVKVIPCSIREFDLLEDRPLNVSMIPNKLLSSTGIQIDSIDNVLDELVFNSFSTR